MTVRARHVALALSVVVVTALTVGTGGFSSMTADRGVAISVAEDEAAYLGITMTEDIEPESGDNITLLTLTDRFAADVERTEVTVTNTSDDALVEVSVIGIDPNGNEFDVIASIECDETPDSEEEKNVQIEASGTGIEVLTNRSVTVGCTALPSVMVENATLSSMTNTTASQTNTTPLETQTNTTTPRTQTG